MKPSDILLAAAARLARTGAWTKDVLARDAHGDKILPHDPLAVQWCAVGALYAEMKGHVLPGELDQYGVSETTELMRINDTADNLEQVLTEMVLRAIRLREEGQ